MHPTLARYMNLEAALDTLRRDDRGEVLRAEEQPYAEAAKARPELRAKLLSAKGLKTPPTEVQQALLVLAAHAAAAALRDDPQLGGRLLVARSALEREGATEEEVMQFIATLVLEEAFSDDVSPDEFDRAFFEDSLREVPELAKLTHERVQGISEAFVKTAADDWRRAHALAAQALIEAAWTEGPQPVNIEHVQAALEQLRAKLPSSERARAKEALRRFTAFLAKAGLVQPARVERLNKAIDGAEGPESGTLPN